MACLNHTLEQNTFCALEYDEEATFENAFQGVYEGPYLKGTIIVTFILLMIGCIGLGFVLWFERSGQAGPYRTLINQLVSYNIEQVSKDIFYLVFLHHTQCFEF